MKKFFLFMIFIVIAVVGSAQSSLVGTLNKAILDRDKGTIVTEIKSLNSIDHLLFKLDNQNPILKLIEINDIELLAFMLDSGWSKSYFDSSEGHEGEICSLAYYALKANNLQILKFLYNYGIFLNDESKNISRQEEHIEDIYSAIKMNCSYEIINFLHTKEKTIDKTYKYLASGSPQFEQGNLIHLLYKRKDFLELVRLLNISHQVNNIFIDNNTYYPKKLTVLDLLEREIDYCKKRQIDNLVLLSNYQGIKQLNGVNNRLLFKNMTATQVNDQIFLSALVQTNALILRDAPNRNGKKLTLLTNGQAINILSLSDYEKIDDINDYWYLIKTSTNEIGFCYGGYLSIKGTNKY